MRKATFCGLVAMILAGTARAEGKLEPAKTPLPIVAWGGVNKASVDLFRELGEDGFTINFSGFGNVDATLKALDMAQAAGVKLMVSFPELKAETESAVARLKGHPALAAYYLRDEPDATLFPELAAWAKRVYAVDASHPCYINLFPTYAIADQMKVPTYAEYLKRYMETVPVKVLSFDHYPVMQGPKGVYLRGDWYGNLEQIAAAAKKAKVPFWAFALSTRCLDFATPSLAGLRLQIFSNLAYGAQGLEYFTYWQVVGSSEGAFDHSPVNADGTHSPTYDFVKQVNAEARGLWPVFAGAEVIDVSHAGPDVPSGTHRFKPTMPIKSFDSPGPAVVSRIRNNGREFLVVVNANVNGPLTLKVRLNAGVKIQRVGKDGLLGDAEGESIGSTLEAGDVAVWTWLLDR